MTLFDDEPAPLILTCGHVWNSTDDWEPVVLCYVVPVSEGHRGAATGSVCPACADRDRDRFCSWDEAWAAARTP